MITTLLCALAVRTETTPQTVTVNVDGVDRQAIVYLPANPSGTPEPLVFGFHGHGGNMNYSARKFRVQEMWPTAAVVYMNGLPTKGMTDPEGTKNGWQQRPGTDGDRDVHFFDKMLEWVKAHAKVDAHRIYSLGHSNGGAFTYVLWKERHDLFAAMAPAAAYTGMPRTLKPLPVIQVSGQNDSIVKFQFQKLCIEAIQRVNGCSTTPTPYGPLCNLYKGKDGNDVAFYEYPGDHGLPPDALPAMIKFLQEHIKP